MINNINGTGCVLVTGNYSSSPSINNNMTGAGMLRWNSLTSQLEVNDGYTWISLNSSFPTIGLTPEAESAIKWAVKKMQKEREEDELCRQYPALGKARDNFELLKRMVENDAPLESIQSSP